MLPAASAAVKLNGKTLIHPYRVIGQSHTQDYFVTLKAPAANGGSADGLPGDAAAHHRPAAPYSFPSPVPQLSATIRQHFPWLQQPAKPSHHISNYSDNQALPVLIKPNCESLWLTHVDDARQFMQKLILGTKLRNFLQQCSPVQSFAEKVYLVIDGCYSVVQL